MAFEVVIGRSRLEMEKYGTRGAVFLGKQYVKMGEVTSLSNHVFLDVASSHVVFLVGKRGGGKSYSAGVIAEGMADLEPEIKNNLSVILLDTMGVYWTMKYPNLKESDLLKSWNLEPKPLDVKIYTPAGFYKKYKEEGIPTDFPFAIRPEDLTAEDWCLTFELSINSPAGVLISRTVHTALDKIGNFSLADLIEIVRQDEETDAVTKHIVINQFHKVEDWGIFAKEGTSLKELVIGGQTTVLDLSPYATLPSGWLIKALVVGLISKRLFAERMLARKTEEFSTIDAAMHYFTREEKDKLEEPLVWLCIDECLPGNSKIITENGFFEIKELIKKINAGEKIKVLSFNENKSGYEYKSVIKGYTIKPRGIIKLRTETGKEICCTADHPVLVRGAYASAITADELATPAVYPHLKEKKLLLARLCGHIWGDGYLSKNEVVGFSGKGNKQDLERIKEDLASLGFSSSSICSRVTCSTIQDETGKKSKVVGFSQEVTASRKAWQQFCGLGLPIGEKVLSSVKIPEWLLHAPKEEKKEFLAALMGSDGWGLGKAKNSKLDFNAIRLSFNKAEELETEAWEIANQICQLFRDVGTEISSIKKRPGNIRKDGKKTIKLQITLSKNISNTLKFLEEIGFRYCRRKEERAKQWLAYLKAYQLRLEELRKKKAIFLELKNSEKHTLEEISRELNLSYKRVRMWSKQSIKLNFIWDFPSFGEWITERSGKGIIYEKIKEIEILPAEELFDMGVEDNHNFIAENFIVHNCHELLPKEGKTTATDSLVTILREGRQPGISLVLISQQPGKIHTDVLTQADIVLSHRITAKIDVDALGQLTQTYMRKGLDEELANLPPVTGSAIIFDDKNERIFPIQVRPRFTWHGGSAPTAMKEKKEMIKRTFLV